jgi:prolyl-tRNA editing enzyme YbaK/EbsC (Cys-tRNA(Pro) deacylase)
MSDVEARPDPRVVRALEESGVAFEIMPCDPALADTEAFCAAYGVDPEDSANTILVAAREDPPRYVACVVLATCRLDVNGVVRRRLGARKASFAPSETASELTGMEVGGVTAVALPPGIPLWVDARVMTRPSIVLGAGTRAAKIRTSPQLFAALAGCDVVPDLAQPKT